MLNSHIKIIKDDVKVSTNGECVDIIVTPADQKGENARATTVTLARTTAVHLREVLETYFKLDSTM